MLTESQLNDFEAKWKVYEDRVTGKNIGPTIGCEEIVYVAPAVVTNNTTAPKATEVIQEVNEEVPVEESAKDDLEAGQVDDSAAEDAAESKVEETKTTSTSSEWKVAPTKPDHPCIFLCQQVRSLFWFFSIS